MTLSRRKMLTLVGGGTILAAAGGTAAFLGTRTPQDALRPWSAAGAYSDPRKNALSYAILAPNPHNRQPWEVALDGSDGITIWRDRTRNLPHTDPFDRQLTVGMGCFLELMTIAASQAGYGVELDLFPDGDDGPIAHGVLKPGASPDPLFAQVLTRRSCREPFQPDAIPAGAVETLSALADIHTSPDTVAEIRALTWDAWEVEMYTPDVWKESIDLSRIGKAEINANPDGISLSGPMFDVLKPLGLLTRDRMMDLDDPGLKRTKEVFRRMLAATPAYAVLRTEGNSRIDQIGAGRRWLRLNLTTSGLGLALHPVSQCLQEYPEMAPHYDRAHALLAGPGETVQMLGRLGYGPGVPRTPRWPLETRMRHA